MDTDPIDRWEPWPVDVTLDGTVQSVLLPPEDQTLVASMPLSRPAGFTAVYDTTSGAMSSAGESTHGDC